MSGFGFGVVRSVSPIQKDTKVPPRLSRPRLYDKGGEALITREPDSGLESGPHPLLVRDDLPWVSVSRVQVLRPPVSPTRDKALVLLAVSTTRARSR